MTTAPRKVKTLAKIEIWPAGTVFRLFYAGSKDEMYKEGDGFIHGVSVEIILKAIAAGRAMVIATNI